MNVTDAIATGRRAIESTLMPDTFATLRGTHGPCGVKLDTGEGTPITIRVRVDADIRPNDTVTINGSTYTVIASPPTHGMSLARHCTLQETARA